MAFSASQSPAVTLSTRNYSLTFDSHGNLWVSAGPTDQIYEYTAPVTSSSIPALTLNLAYSPSGIALDSSGNLFVGDYGGSLVHSYAAPIISSSVQSLQFSIGGANQMKFDSHGDLWIASGSLNQVVDIATPLTGPTVLKIINVGFTDPTDVAFDSSGNLWVSNYASNNVVEFSAAAVASCVASPCSLATTKTLSVTSPNSLAVDPSGNLWVVSNTGAKVEEFSSPYTSSSLSLTVGLGTDVTAVRTDSAGNVWVADRGTSQILEYRASTPGPARLIPPSPPALLNLTTYGGLAVQGSFVGMSGIYSVVYNFRSLNETQLTGELAKGNYTLYPNTFSVCSTQVDGSAFLRVSGFGSATWGGSQTNSTEIVFGDYQSFLTSAAGWPTEPACTS